MKEIQINGPYFTNYSYAKVNRGLALALNKIKSQTGYYASVYCDPDKIDYLPNKDELEKVPELKNLVESRGENPGVVIYNNFPKNITSEHGLAELKGDIKLMYIAWEESIYPEEWVEEINQNLHGVMVATSFVRDILRNSGVKVPIAVVPNAIDDQMKLPPKTIYPLNTTKNFKFLHISTAKKRKGVDVLLRAYFEEFTSNDDVTLIIKSFPGPDNNVDQILSELKSELSKLKGVSNFPEVVHINNPDLTADELTSLITQSDCSVYPSRAEGFGLPILESMYHEVPVIATNYSGYLDFCDETCAYMIDYKLEYANDSELANIGAKWAEPDLDHLKNLMRKLYIIKEKSSQGSLSDEEEDRNLKIKLAKVRADSLTWDNSSVKTIEFIQKIENLRDLKLKSAGVLSFVNDETGIAEYTNDLYKKIEHSFEKFYYLGNADVVNNVRKDEFNVLRLWNTGEKDFDQLQEWIKKEGIDIMHIQYHSGSMFSPESLSNLIQSLKELKVRTFVTLHAVRGDSFDFIKDCRNLNLAEKVIIHNQKDFEYAKATLQNVELFAIPVKLVRKFNKEKLKKKLGFEDNFPIVATHGLMNKNKGIDNIVKAIAKLKHRYPNILFLSLSAISSNNIFAQGIYEDLLKLIKENNLEDNVSIITEFLDNEVVNILLQACEINVFAYSDAGESGSAAVRKALSVENPTIVTDIIQFSEFNEEVVKIPNNDSEYISNAISNLLENDETIEEMRVKMRDFVQKNNYETKSLELLDLYSQR